MATKPTTEQPQQSGLTGANNDAQISQNANEITFGMGDSDDFGMRPSSQKQTLPRATGSRLKPFEKFLVKLKIISVAPPYPGLPASSKLISAKVMDKIGKSKLEPDLVYGSRKKRDAGLIGFNQQFIPDERTPIQLWFPENAVKENDSIKAGEAKITVKDGSGVHEQIFYFFEYKGGETLAAQETKCREEYEYKHEEN